MTILWEVLGWAGAAALLLAYALLSAGKLAPDRTYHLINIAGSVGLGANSLFHHAFPGVLVNTVWLLIGVVTLVEASRRRGRPSVAGATPDAGSPGHGETTQGRL